MKTRKNGNLMHGKQFLCITIGLALIFALLIPSALGAPPASAPPDTAGMTFANVTGDGGADIITYTDRRKFEALVPLPAGADAADIASSVRWSLTRTEGALDPTLFPFQYMGGALSSFRLGNVASYFSGIATTAADIGGAPALKLTFQNANVVSGGSVRTYLPDYTGYYQLTCTAPDGGVLGVKTVRVAPYDDYYSMDEINDEILKAKEAALAKGIYAEVHSLGQSYDGRNMPYIILAGSQADISGWQDFLSFSIENPTAALAYYNENKDAVKVPVLYSNIHANEIEGVDGIVNFMWDLIDGVTTPKPYKNIDSLTEVGKAKIAAQRVVRGQATSTLIEPFTTYIGGITANDNSDASSPIPQATLESYYNISNKTFDTNEIFKKLFFIIVPEENVDGRTYTSRQGGGGVDLNRDNLFQTQPETRNMTAMIALWNPVAFFELHDTVSNFQVEPCSPPHEPNVEYDLFAEMGVRGGEAFGATAAINQPQYNSYQMPLRDYLDVTPQGQRSWSAPWDDMSTNYTPQYSMLHGTVAYTVESPGTSENSVKALEHGLIGHTTQVWENKNTYMENLLIGFRRGVLNEDPDSVRDWYVDVADNIAAEADVYRPRNEENGNFFPEYYVIPLDDENQRDLSEAYKMQEFLLRNRVKVSELTEDVTVKGVTYKKGAMVVDMHQAKRNVANGALYDSVLITTWPTLYSEPTTSFDKLRGFDCHEIRVEGAFADKLIPVTQAGGATYYKGDAGDAVVISNNSVDAVKAINLLLNEGRTVGYVTDGPYKSNFVVSYSDFVSIRDTGILQAYGLKESPPAKKLKKPTIYITSMPQNSTSNYIYNSFLSAYGYNYTMHALVDEMGFAQTTDVSEADIILSGANTQTWERAAVQAAIAAGKPALIMAARSFTLNISGTPIATLFGAVSGGSTTDCLTTVTYGAPSITTDSYRAQNDNIIYGFGGNYFGAVPEGARVLIQNTNDTPFGGFIRQANLTPYLGKPVALAYERDFGDGVRYDLTLFANTLTHKMHQKDDYRFASNTIYSKVLGDDVVIDVVDGYQGVVTKIEADKGNKTLYVTGAGYEPGADVTVLVKYAGEPSESDYDEKLVVRADYLGSVNLALNGESISGAPWLGGHKYFVKLGSSVGYYTIETLLNVVHSSARASVKRGRTFTLDYQSDSAYRKFSSSNAAVATVDPDTGVVTPQKAGSVVITLETTDGSALKSTLILTVTP